VLQKVEEEGVKLTLIAPIWATQPWFSKILHLMAADSYILPNMSNLLQLPSDPNKLHSIQSMRLAVFRLSGTRSENLTYREKLSTLFCHHGGSRPNASIGAISRNGCYFAVENKLIRLTHL